MAQADVDRREVPGRVPQQEERVEVGAGEQDAGGTDFPFRRSARRELLQQGLQPPVGRARVDVEEVEVVLLQAPARTP